MKLKSRRSRAFLLVETILAGLLVGVVMVLTVRLVAFTAAERRSAERRGWAVQEAANAMERIAGLPFDRLTAEGVRPSTRLSDAARQALPGSRIEAEVGDEPEGLRRIDVRVTWRGPGGVDEAPVRLSAWVARKEEAR